MTDTDTDTTDRERSFWGWGYTDRLPDEDDRRDLKARVENQLGFPERPLLDMPTLDDVTLPNACSLSTERLSHTTMPSDAFTESTTSGRSPISICGRCAR
jgi:alkyldihydroxyacetonephosphate synthase